MSLASQPNLPAPAKQRSLLPFVVGGCAVLAVCIACGAALAGFFIFYPQRSVTTASAPSVEYILDATQRMSLKADGENDTRLNVARSVLAEIVRPADPAVTAGLRVFGSGAQPAACSDTDLLVPLAPANQSQISTHLLSITNGANPDAAMGQALLSAIRDLAAFKGKHTLVVVTGGADSCNPQAGELMAAEAQKAGIDLKLFVVGYQVSSGDGNAIKGLVDASGGNYVEADNKEQLKDVLTSIQQFVQDNKATTVTNIIATAAAAVGTQNVAVGATAPAGATVAPGTPAPGGSATPAASATLGAPIPGSMGQTACDNPYFPMRTGATWSFAGDDGPATWTVTGVTGDSTSADATMQVTASGNTSTQHWHCSTDGLDSYDFGLASLPAGGPDFSETDHSGTWLPPVGRLFVGVTWDNSYTFKGTDTSSGITVMSINTQHFTLIGLEPHDVHGQTIDSLHIETTGTSRVEASGIATHDFPTRATYILARGVGPVLFTVSFNGIVSHTTLTSYSIP
jgi:hypothetical protein